MTQTKRHVCDTDYPQPGEYIREELVERGWTQMDLAEILGRPPQVVNEIVAGKRSITPETARGLGDAFGTSAQLWMNLEASYQLSRVSAKDDTVSRRALLYGLAPIKEMQRRGWIETTSNAEILETQVLGFFEISTLDQPIRFAHAARKSTDGSLTQAHCRRSAGGATAHRCSEGKVARDHRAGEKR